MEQETSNPITIEEARDKAKPETHVNPKEDATESDMRVEGNSAASNGSGEVSRDATQSSKSTIGRKTNSSKEVSRQEEPKSSPSPLSSTDDSESNEFKSSILNQETTQQSNESQRLSSSPERVQASTEQVSEDSSSVGSKSSDSKKDKASLRKGKWTVSASMCMETGILLFGFQFSYRLSWVM